MVTEAAVVENFLDIICAMCPVPRRIIDIKLYYVCLERRAWAHGLNNNTILPSLLFYKT